MNGSEVACRCWIACFVSCVVALGLLTAGCAMDRTSSPAGCDRSVPDMCNGHDDDCDGTTDEGVDETCNGHDDDCDERIDEAFDLATDLSNCGACGAACALPGASFACVDGECHLEQCLEGFADTDMDPETGCEQTCQTSEVCNRLDDDCDGDIDEDATGGECEARVLQIAPGAEHTCALREGGEVYCWGNGNRGQLGTGSDLERLRPTRVAGLTHATEIGSGRFFSCALRSTGNIQCWGENSWGQLGSFVSLDYYNLPVDIEGATLAVSLGVGLFHSCFVNEEDDVRCWGWNGHGQLGVDFDGDFSVERLPVRVPDVHDVKEVSAGFAFTCALHTNGTVSCWGDNELGELGDGSTMSRLTPELVETEPGEPLDSVIALSAGGASACALREGEEAGEGTVLCWGDNSGGGVGAMDFGHSVRRATSTGVDESIEIGAGYNFSCARRADGSVWCWGTNEMGQLGVEGLTPQPPTEIDGLTARGLHVGHGDFHACALREDSAVMCWGANMYGQLGVGFKSHEPQRSPVRADL